MDFCEGLFKFNFSSRCYRIRKTSNRKASHTSIPQNDSLDDESEEESISEADNAPVFKAEERESSIDHNFKAACSGINQSSKKLPGELIVRSMENKKKFSQQESPQ